MKETFKNVIKNGLTMFAVGIALGLAAPLIAEVLVGTGMLTAAAAAAVVPHSVLWSGAFFGAFGAIHAAVAPALEYVFSPSSPPPHPHATTPNASCCEQAPVIVANVAADMDIRPPLHTQKLDAERASGTHSYGAPRQSPGR